MNVKQQNIKKLCKPKSYFLETILSRFGFLHFQLHVFPTIRPAIPATLPKTAISMTTDGIEAEVKKQT